MLSPGQYTSKWSKWITLKLRHREKNIKVIDDIELSPSDDTADFLKRINAVSKKHNDTYAILINDLRSVSLISQLKTIPEKINFEGKVNNKNFLLYSDTEYLPDRLYVNYINNLKSSRIDEWTQSLHKGDFLKTTDLETLELVGSQFFLALPRVDDKVKVTFLDARQQEFENVRYTIHTISETSSQLTCDFFNCVKGACTIQIEGKNIKKVYISEKKQLHIAVELFLKPDSKSPSLIQPDRLNTANYKITFDIKKTYWRYILISKSEDRNVYDIKEVHFELNGEKIPTESIQKTELVNGIRCLHITFKDEMPLRLNTFNHETMKLRISSANKWMPASMRAPIPTYKSVQRTERMTGKSYSLMYLYI